VSRVIGNERGQDVCIGGRLALGEDTGKENAGAIADHVFQLSPICQWQRALAKHFVHRCCEIVERVNERSIKVKNQRVIHTEPFVSLREQRGQMAVGALVFDVDGTLAETEELHRQAFNETFAAAGLDWYWPSALYRQLLQVTGGKERIQFYITHFAGLPVLSPDAIARLHAEKTARYAALMAEGGITLREGVRELLDEAQAAGLLLAIATTTSPTNVTALLQATLGPGGPSRFALIAAGDCVAAKKPAPDIYQHVLDQLGLPPESCIAFEDTPIGLQAAMAAGIPTIITPSQYSGPGGFDGALAVVDSLGDLSWVMAVSQQAQRGLVLP
jgi:beta-phosphoglucomutase-like phosphatase (HAD superfamily)